MQLTSKTALFGISTALIGLIGIELVARVVFSIATGESKLGYGLGSNEPEQKSGMLFPKKTDSTGWHTVLRADDREKTFLAHETGSYSKYQPHQYKRNRDQYGHLSDIHINNLGFRGPDVTAEKPRDVYRVIVLGASSTFGYRNRDTETYPHYLGLALNERLRNSQACHGTDAFEILNLGIPHLNTANIHSLLVAEGLGLDPDLVTFYEGANETRLIEASWMQRGLTALGNRLLVARFVQSMLRSTLSSFDAGELEQHAEGMSPIFLNHLSAIADATDAAGVHLLVASQQAKSFLIPTAQMSEYAHADEVLLVQNKLNRQGSIALKEMIFLMHAELMENLREWTAQRAADRDSLVAFVDIARRFDSLGKRDQLLSWVHLTAEANRIVAAEFAGPIFDRACGEPAQRSAGQKP